MHNDHAIVLEVLSGNQAAFRNLLERYEHRVYGFTLKMLGDPQLAEDATQETFLAVYRSLKQYDEAKSFSTWLFVIAKHTVYSMLKKRQKNVIVSDDVLSYIADEGAVVENKIIENEEKLMMLESIDTLSSLHQQVISMKFFEEVSNQEIANRLGVTTKKIENTLFVAKKKLRAKLQSV